MNIILREALESACEGLGVDVECRRRTGEFCLVVRNSQTVNMVLCEALSGANLFEREPWEAEDILREAFDFEWGYIGTCDGVNAVRQKTIYWHGEPYRREV